MILQRPFPQAPMTFILRALPLDRARFLGAAHLGNSGCDGLACVERDYFATRKWHDYSHCTGPKHGVLVTSSVRQRETVCKGNDLDN